MESVSSYLWEEDGLYSFEQEGFLVVHPVGWCQHRYNNTYTGGCRGLSGVPTFVKFLMNLTQVGLRQDFQGC